MRFLALLLLLLNVLAFAYWYMFDPPPPPQQVHVSAYLPKGVEKLPLLSEVKKADEAIMLADTGAANAVAAQPQPQPVEISEVLPETSSAPVTEASQPLAAKTTTEKTAPPATEPDPFAPEPFETADNAAASMVEPASTANDSIAQLPEASTEIAQASTEPPEVLPTETETTATDIFAAEEVPDLASATPASENPSSPSSAERQVNKSPSTGLFAPSPQTPPAPLASNKSLSDSAARTFSNLANYRTEETPAKDNKNHKTALNANSPNNRPFLSAAELPAANAAPTTAPALPSTEFQPVSQGSRIFQVPTPVANLGLSADTTNDTATAGRPVPPPSPTTVKPPPKATPAVLSTPKPPPTTSSKPANTEQSSATSTTRISTPKPASRQTRSKTLCFRSGTFNQRASAEQAQRWLQNKQVQVSLKADVKKEKIATWLYLPPFQTRALARQAEQELARRGVKDFYLVTKAPWYNAIALGLFNQDASAKRRLAELKRKGYYNVRVQHRYKDQSRYWLDLSLPENQQATLQSFVQTFKVLPPKQVSCQ